MAALEATKIISDYPPYKLRTDMSSQEYTQFKYDWNTFDRVWIYNYAIESSNLNATITGGIQQSPYDFISNQEKLSYLRGQASHVAAYPSTTIFITPEINKSTFNSLSTSYGTILANSLSTVTGIRTAERNLIAYLGNLSTLASLSTQGIESDGTVSISSIISPYDISTLYSLEGIVYISTLVYNTSVDIIPPIILPIGLSTIGKFVPEVPQSPNTFCSYLVSSLVSPISDMSLYPGPSSIYNDLSSFQTYNTIYVTNPGEISTFNSLNHTVSSFKAYSFFPQTSINLLKELSNTFPYPPSRVSTYASLSTLASYSTIYNVNSTMNSTFVSFSNLLNLSTTYTSSLTDSNLSTLFFMSTRVSLYNYLSIAILPFEASSTLATLSSYRQVIN